MEYDTVEVRISENEILYKKLKDKVDYIIDGGISDIGIRSTIVKV